MTDAMVARVVGAAMLVAASGPFSPAAAGEEATVKAFAEWQGRGYTVQTGVKQATFVGMLAGRMYAETEKGPVQTGLMACPAMLEIGLDDGTQKGQGRCTITAKDGARIFAEIACTGVFLVGCDGDLKLTGGTERFAGVTGGGKVLIRSDDRQIAATPSGAANSEGSGILYVRELSYKLP